MFLTVDPTFNKTEVSVILPASKSQSNRALIIKALSSTDLEIENLSAAEDTLLLKMALEALSPVININHSGTALRFLCAFLCLQKGVFVLTGSSRIKKRPIKELVFILRQLGAQIEFTENDNFAPLKITGNPHFEGGKVELDSTISSQFTSALMMIAPCLKNGLELQLTGDAVSSSFVNLTKEMMEYQGIQVIQENHSILIANQKYNNRKIKIESDFASASYWYSILLVSSHVDKIYVNNLCKKSTQPDKKVIEIFSLLGIESNFQEKNLTISKNRKFILPVRIELDLQDAPDLAQTIMCVCSVLNIELFLTGLSTLPNKETNRLLAMKLELKKFGIKVTINSESSIHQSGLFQQNRDVIIETYDDHRMAMAFSCFMFANQGVNIKDPAVVNKSYPGFWEEISKISNLVYTN
ncbi:MAG: 3-phosphoshikimate 1-carboxyvinyltransferase [Saprospiraceae bacterium]|nr:3-phosphoshikimate 1-carboxyvinyltransferase [Saprospiraceae bacterium]